MGIHERSSREKISHVMNGAAHIMNDEATRKYLSAVKRLLTFVQRAYPTDPSRCVDFDGFRNPKPRRSWRRQRQAGAPMYRS